MKDSARFVVSVWHKEKPCVQLLFAAIFFLVGLTPKGHAQTAQPLGTVVDDEGRALAPRSQLLGKKLPKKVDLRSELPPVADQGDSWSQTCVTFATAYYQMSQYVKHFKHPEWDLTNPEHQFSVQFCYKLTGSGSPPSVYYVLKQYGCVDNAEMPYCKTCDCSAQPTNNQFEAAKQYRINSYAAVWDNGTNAGPYTTPPNPIQAAKAWLADGYVLSVGIDPQSPGMPNSSTCTSPTDFLDIVDTNHVYSAGHGVAICGYNDNINPRAKDPDHRGGFLMVNSEGPAWNGDMHGYIWLSYAYVKQCISDCYLMFMDGQPDAPAVTGCAASIQCDYNCICVTISGTKFGAYRRLATVTINGEVPAFKLTGWSNEFVTLMLTHASCVSSGPLVLYDWEGTPSNPVQIQIPQQNAAPGPE